MKKLLVLSLLLTVSFLTTNIPITANAEITEEELESVAPDLSDAMSGLISVVSLKLVEIQRQNIVLNQSRTSLADLSRQVYQITSDQVITNNELVTLTLIGNQLTLVSSNLKDIQDYRENLNDVMGGVVTTLESINDILQSVG